MKIVFNECYGGFSLSPKAEELYWHKKEGKKLYWFELAPGNAAHNQYVPTDDPGNSIFAVAYFTEDRSGDNASLRDVKRNDPTLVEVVEELKEAANGRYAELKVVEIPDDVEWIIQEYDGLEWVAEKHRTWS